MEGPRHLKRTRQDVVYDTIIFIILTFILLIVAYPLYFVIISSFSDPVAVAGGKVVFYPIGFTLDGYKEVFKTKTVVRGFANSLLYSAVGVGVNLNAAQEEIPPELYEVVAEVLVFVNDMEKIRSKIDLR